MLLLLLCFLFHSTYARARVRFVTSSCPFILTRFFVVEMGGVSSKITQATRFDTNELFTDLLIHYMSIIRFILKSREKKHFVSFPVISILFRHVGQTHTHTHKMTIDFSMTNAEEGGVELDCPKR